MSDYQLPEGYKQTEIVAIPEDWGIVPLGNIATFQGGYAFSSKNFREGGRYQVVKMSNLYAGELDLKRSNSFLDEISENEKVFFLNKDDILISLTGTVGKTDFGYTCRINDERNLLLNQRVSRIVVNEKSVPALIEVETKLNRFRKQFFDRAKGGTGNQTNVSTIDLATILIPLPPTIEEQRSLSQALSDLDALIAALNKLIAKNRDLKTATMQQLLTGKKRLLGFGEGQGYKESVIGLIPEDWDVYSLSQVCSAIVDGTHYTPSYVTDGVPFYSVENVTANDFKNTKYISDTEHLKLIKRCKPEKGDLLLTRIGSLGVTKLIDWNIDASIYVSLALLKLNEKVYPSYVYVYSKSEQFLKNVEKRSLTNATPQKINMGDIGNVLIPIPSNQIEQRAIATVLSDMDNAISALESRLTKTQTIRQGMMQELLTGRIRLKIEK